MVILGWETQCTEHSLYPVQVCRDWQQQRLGLGIDRGLALSVDVLIGILAIGFRFDSVHAYQLSLEAYRPLALAPSRVSSFYRWI